MSNTQEMISSQVLPLNYKGKRVLITGASGFIGTHLSAKVLAMGAEVHATSRIKRDSKGENVTWWQGSFEDADSAQKLLHQINPDYIFHLAGEVTASHDLALFLPVYHSVLTSTINLLTLARHHAVERIVFLGSCTEPTDDMVLPASSYALAKSTATRYIKAFHQYYQVPGMIVRPYMGYGPGQFHAKLIPYVINQLLKGKSPELSQGKWMADWVYIEDIIAGLVEASLTPGLDGEEVDIATGEMTSVRDVVEQIYLLIQPIGKPIFGALQDRPGENFRKADIENSIRLFNFKARTTLKQGLQKTIDWYQSTM